MSNTRRIAIQDKDAPKYTTKITTMPNWLCDIIGGRPHKTMMSFTRAATPLSRTWCKICSRHWLVNLSNEYIRKRTPPRKADDLRLKRLMTVFWNARDQVSSDHRRSNANDARLYPPPRLWSGHDGSPTQPKDAAGLRDPAMKETKMHRNTQRR